MNRFHRDELAERLTVYDEQALREIILQIADHDFCLVVSTLGRADWHINHPELCSQPIPAFDEHTERAKQMLAAPETGQGAS